MHDHMDTRTIIIIQLSYSMLHDTYLDPKSVRAS